MQTAYVKIGSTSKITRTSEVVCVQKCTGRAPSSAANLSLSDHALGFTSANTSDGRRSKMENIYSRSLVSSRDFQHTVGAFNSDFDLRDTARSRRNSNLPSRLLSFDHLEDLDKGGGLIVGGRREAEGACQQGTQYNYSYSHLTLAGGNEGVTRD